MQERLRGAGANNKPSHSYGGDDAKVNLGEGIVGQHEKMSELKLAGPDGIHPVILKSLAEV